jgi:hypothetical protein
MCWRQAKRWAYTVDAFSIATKKLEELLNKAFMVWEKSTDLVAKSISDMMPAASLIQNRLIMRDEVLYETLVKGVESAQQSGVYREATEIVLLLQQYESITKAMADLALRSFARLKQARLYTRKCVALEWAVTKIKQHTPQTAEEIPAHADMIEAKLQKKGVLLKELPEYVGKLLKAMRDAPMSNPKPEEVQPAADDAIPLANVDS